jgi:RNA polymerase sigma-70 factor (ECF subfamily)
MALVERPSSRWETTMMARVAAGDDAALAELYDQFSPFVFGLAHRVIGETTAAEDVLQEVFLHLWEKPGAFDAGRGSLRSWLGVLTHRRAVDRVRREVAARRREQREAAQPVAAPPDIAEAATAVVVTQRLREAVAALPPDQRVAVQLAYFGGRTFRDVASVLGIPEGTAKSRLRLALKKLGDVLSAEGITQWT